MKFDSIEINGTPYRVEFNWNAITNFMESEGLKLTDVDKLDNLTAKQITNLIYHGVVEGCRMERVEFPFGLQDFGAALNVHTVSALLQIYKTHTEVAASKVSKKK